MRAITRSTANSGIQQAASMARNGRPRSKRSWRSCWESLDLPLSHLCSITTARSPSGTLVTGRRSPATRGLPEPRGEGRRFHGSHSRRLRSRLAALHHESLQQGSRGVGIAAVGDNLEARLHAIEAEVDGDVAAMASLEVAHMRIIREEAHELLVRRRIGGDRCADELRGYRW